MSYSITPDAEESLSSQVDPVKLEQLMRAKTAEQNMLLAVAAGFLASVGAAILWAAITYATSYQIGFMAIGVGFVVGYAVKALGKGMTPVFGVVGAVFALFGCLFGNFLTAFVALSQLEDSSSALVLSTFVTSPGLIVDVMKETFSPIDLLFYAIAVYEGFKLSFGGPSEEELAEIQKRPETV